MGGYGGKSSICKGYWDIGGFLRVKRLVKRHFKGQKLSLITGGVFFFEIFRVVGTPYRITVL